MLPSYFKISDAIEDASNLVNGRVNSNSLIYTGYCKKIDDYLNIYASGNLAGLREKMIFFAQKFGFPNSSAERQHVAILDVGLAAILHEHLIEYKLRPTAAIANNLRIWMFFNICLIPDILFWRWSGNKNQLNIERFIDKRRNYCGYLWMASWLLIDESNEASKWELLNQFGVDSLVQIIERPGVSYYQPFARELARKVIGSRNTRVRLNDSDLVRGIMKRARFTMGVVKHTSNIEINRQLVEHLACWAEKYYENKSVSSNL